MHLWNICSFNTFATAKFPFSSFSPISISPYSGLKSILLAFQQHISITFPQTCFVFAPFLPGVFLFWLISVSLSRLVTCGQEIPFAHSAARLKGQESHRYHQFSTPAESEEQRFPHFSLTVLFPPINFLDPCHSPYFSYLYVLVPSLQILS